MILKIESNQDSTQGWRIIQLNEIDICGFSSEENYGIHPNQIKDADKPDNFDLIDLRIPHKLCAESAAGHFLQIIVDRKKAYWVNGQVFLMNDAGKTIDKLY
ncbi:MAG TPA: hypothetical protein VFD03_06215 [Clostridia bacterium]|nr:hypothetical protein [Clostridia bacterium]